MEKFGVIELSSQEMISVEGGKSLSYYVGLVIGTAAGTVVSLLKGIEDGLNGQHK
jgi:hypothetical protein